MNSGLTTAYGNRKHTGFVTAPSADTLSLGKRERHARPRAGARQGSASPIQNSGQNRRGNREAVCDTPRRSLARPLPQSSPRRLPCCKTRRSLPENAPHEEGEREARCRGPAAPAAIMPQAGGAGAEGQDAEASPPAERSHPAGGRRGQSAARRRPGAARTPQWGERRSPPLPSPPRPLMTAGRHEVTPR